MLGIKVGGALAATMAISLILAVGAYAKAAGRSLFFDIQTGGNNTLPVTGDPAQEQATGSLVFNAGNVQIQCSQASLNGVLQPAGEKLSPLYVGHITSAFAGPMEEPCTSTLGPAAVTLDGVSDGLSTNGKAVLEDGEPVSFFDVEFISSSLECTFALKKVDGTLNTEGNPIVITDAATAFKREQEAGNPNWRECPKKGTMEGDSWKLTAAASPEGGPMYPVIVRKESPP